MSAVSRIAIATTMLVAGFGGSIAQAQSRSSHPAPADYYALSDGSSIDIERAAPVIAPVPPSTSDTVMGLRVPR